MNRLDETLRRINANLAAPAITDSPEWQAAEEAQRAAWRAEHEAEQEAKREDILRACGSSEQTIAALMELDGPLSPCTARTAARQFMGDAKAVFLLLLGSVGSGKTLAACEAFWSLRAPIVSPYFGPSWVWRQGPKRWNRLTGERTRSAPGLLVKASRIATLSLYGEGREELEWLCMHPFLVVDEIGPECGKSFPAMFADLIDARYGAHLRTIVTGNISAQAFRELYGPRVVDRLRQFGLLKQCSEPSFRERR